MPDIGITNLANNPFGNGSSSDYGHMSPETSFGYQNAYSNYLTDFFKANPDMFGKTDAQHYQSQKDNFMAQMASNPTTAEAFKINQSTPTKPFINPHEGTPSIWDAPALAQTANAPTSENATYQNSMAMQQAINAEQAKQREIAAMTQGHEMSAIPYTAEDLGRDAVNYGFMGTALTGALGSYRENHGKTLGPILKNAQIANRAMDSLGKDLAHAFKVQDFASSPSSKARMVEFFAKNPKLNQTMIQSAAGVQNNIATLRTQQAGLLAKGKNASKVAGKILTAEAKLDGMLGAKAAGSGFWAGAKNMALKSVRAVSHIPVVGSAIAKVGGAVMSAAVRHPIIVGGVLAIGALYAAGTVLGKALSFLNPFGD